MDAYDVLGQQIIEALKREDQAANAELLADALVTTGDTEILGGGLDWNEILGAAAKTVPYKPAQWVAGVQAALAGAANATSQFLNSVKQGKPNATAYNSVSSFLTQALFLVQQESAREQRGIMGDGDDVLGTVQGAFAILPALVAVIQQAQAVLKNFQVMATGSSNAVSAAQQLIALISQAHGYVSSMSPPQPTIRQQRGIMGDAVGAFDWGSLINAGAEAANKGVQYKADQDAQNKAKTDSTVAAAKAIAADANWASAEQQLDLQQQSRVPNATATAAAQALQASAMQAAMVAGSGLSPDAQAKRAAAAQDAANKASQASLAAPGNAQAAALMRAWQKVVAGASAGSASGGGGALEKFKGKGGGESWWTASHGGVPGWGIAVGGAVAGTGLILLLKKLFSRK